MSRRSLRTRGKNVDYSQIGSHQGLSDDEAMPQNTFESESEGYNEEANQEDQNEEEEINDIEHENADEEEEDINESGSNLSSKKKKSRAKGQGATAPVDLPPHRKKKVTTLSSLTNDKKSVHIPDSKKNQRSENLKDRFILFFGPSDEELVSAAFLRTKWGDHPFAVVMNSLSTPKCMQDEIEKVLYDLPVTGGKMTEINYSSTNLPDSDGEILVQTEKVAELTQIKCFESVNNTTSQSLIINCGYPIGLVAWAPGHDGGDQYLAVSTLDSDGSLKTEEQLANLSAYKRVSYPSCIQIYTISSTFQSRLYASITTSYGSPSSMKWRPIPPVNGDQKDHVGIIACAFQDGIVRVFQVPKHNTSGTAAPVHYLLDTPILEYRLEGKILTLCWRTNNIIVVGTSDGFIAEFDISDESVEGTVPSYYYPLHDTVITDVTSAFPDEPNLIFTSGADGYCRSVDVRDLRRAKSITARLKGYCLKSAYSPQIKSFVSLEDVMTSRLNPIRRLATVQGGTAITRHSGGAIQSVAASIYHPFLITGAADGSFHVGNVLRRTLLTRRLTNTFYKQACLWRLDINTHQRDKKVYRFVDINKASDLGKHNSTERVLIHPPEVAIMYLDWNPNIRWAGVYAAGTASGLLRIENMCVQ